jgi:hypothetical protein
MDSLQYSHPLAVHLVIIQKTVIEEELQRPFSSLSKEHIYNIAEPSQPRVRAGGRGENLRITNGGCSTPRP